MYTALYRQFRPESFDEIVGQGHIVDTLKNQIINGNIGHGYLFSGTRGTGKTSTAKILSRAVNCLNLQDGNPCNKCENCLSILNDTNIDVIEMDAASNRGVNDIRELRDKVKYPPSKGKKKVYIIDEVHMLTTEAFNALLKTLEEPPSHLLFILATTEPERLPDTILSRLQRYDFKRITADDIVKSLKNIFKRLNLPAEEEALWLISKIADGSMRDALSIADTAASFSKDKITYERVAEILGAVNKEVIFKLTDDILKGDVNSALLAVDNLLKEGRDVNQFILDIIEHYRNLMIIKSGADSSKLIQINEQSLLEYEKQAENFELSYIINVLDELNKIDEELRYSNNPRILLEMAIIRSAKVENLSLEERIKRLESLTSGEFEIKAKEPEIIEDKNLVEENTNYSDDEYIDINEIMNISVSAEETKVKEENKREAKEPKSETTERVEESEEIETEETQSEKTDSITIDEVKEQWAVFLENIRLDKPNVHGVLREGDIVRVINDKIELEYRENYGFHMNAAKNHTDYIKEKLKEVYNKDLEIDFQIELHTGPDRGQLIKNLHDKFGEDKVTIID